MPTQPFTDWLLTGRRVVIEPNRQTITELIFDSWYIGVSNAIRPAWERDWSSVEAEFWTTWNYRICLEKSFSTLKGRKTTQHWPSDRIFDTKETITRWGNNFLGCSRIVGINNQKYQGMANWNRPKRQICSCSYHPHTTRDIEWCINVGFCLLKFLVGLPAKSLANSIFLSIDLCKITRTRLRKTRLKKFGGPSKKEEYNWGGCKWDWVYLKSDNIANRLFRESASLHFAFGIYIHYYWLILCWLSFGFLQTDCSIPKAICNSIGSQHIRVRE